MVTDPDWMVPAWPFRGVGDLRGDGLGDDPVQLRDDRVDEGLVGIVGRSRPLRRGLGGLLAAFSDFSYWAIWKPTGLKPPKFGDIGA